MTAPGYRATDCVVQVFARAPATGAVKTRLIPALGARGAARLYVRLVGLTLERAAAAAAGPVELWCASDPGHPFFAWCRRRYGLVLRRQSEGDLGARMRHALGCALGAGAGSAILIGTDCPARTAQALRAAAARLRAGARLVLEPAVDGGYTLVGVRTAVPEVFDGVPWGSQMVLAATRARAAALGLRVHELPRTWDLDRPEDLERLAAHPELRALTAGLRIGSCPA